MNVSIFDVFVPSDAVNVAVLLIWLVPVTVASMYSMRDPLGGTEMPVHVTELPLRDPPSLDHRYVSPLWRGSVTVRFVSDCDALLFVIVRV